MKPFPESGAGSPCRQVNPMQARKRLAEVLAQARMGNGLDAESARFLLELTEPALMLPVFEAARSVRQACFGDRVFLYGFIYLSTFCRNDCIFCRSRRSNSGMIRYRKRRDDILSAARRLAAAGVHLVDLTMGEDPRFFEDGFQEFDDLADTVRSVRTETGLPVMVSPGVVPPPVLAKLARAGADWYACYQETHRPSLFAELRPGQSYTERWQAKVDAAASGFLVEEGIMCGAGETIGDMIASIAMMRGLDADQVRAMSFVPQPGTPMADHGAPNALREYLMIAVMRLAFPERLIPASLDVAGADGIRPRLQAGANVITSVIVPGAGFAGVAHARLDIENEGRMPHSLVPAIRRCGLEPGTLKDYQAWVRGRRRFRRHQTQAGRQRC